MAIKSSDGTYVTVEKGDTLWAIARDYLGSGSKYQELADINGIANPDKIYVGQKIYLTKQAANAGTGSGSGSSSNSGTSDSNKVMITAFGEQANSDNTLFITWNWGKENQTASYSIEWTYRNGSTSDSGDNVWFIQNASNSVDENNPAASRQATFSVPAGTIEVKVRVKPVSKKETKDNVEKTYFTGQWTDYRSWTDTTPLVTPSTPSVEIKDYTLTASLENISITGATKIVFQVYRKNGSEAYKEDTATISGTKTASYQWTVDAGGEYMVRCRATDGSTYSDWSAFSSAVKSPPAASSGITTIRATSKTSVYLEWAASDATTSYDIEYTTEKRYFEGSDGTSSKTGIADTHYEFTGLTTGDEYFFRVRAVNEKGNSAWSDIVSVTIGEKPSAPTTWSSTTTGTTGEKVTLYWVHNAVDGSSQTFAELEITIDGVKKTYTIENTKPEDEKDKTSSYTVDTSSYSEGTKITWRVRTAGITKEYGDWSAERTIDIYAPPTLELQVKNANGNAISTMTSFPLYIYALPGPKTQAPLSYHLSIIANESYETTDNIGNVKIVGKGEEVYSQFYDIAQELLVELLPHSVDLENGVKYTVSCTVSMDSGLTATETRDFTVSWTDEIYTPNATIEYDRLRYVTRIRPFCAEYRNEYRKVTSQSNGYVVSSQVIDHTTLNSVYTTTGEKVYLVKSSTGNEIYYCTVWTNQNGDSITPAWYKVNNNSGSYVKTTTTINITAISRIFTTTGEEVLLGVTDSGTEVRYCVVETSTLVKDVTLSVYRREYDGKFVEIATGLKNTKYTYVTDPHPALDYARYRVIAISDKTGAVSFYDVPGYPIGESAIIIQWEEAWSNFDVTGDNTLKEPAWTGSLLRLPYNVDISDSNNIDVTHVEYIGRSHPVSYYGTQLGVASNWSVDIDAKDKETLYALRRLAIWTGDVYVREPSGSGYWATIKVSFSKVHCEVTIPVSLSVTRVEGGV